MLLFRYLLLVYYCSLLLYSPEGIVLPRTLLVWFIAVGGIE